MKLFGFLTPLFLYLIAFHRGCVICTDSESTEGTPSAPTVGESTSVGTSGSTTGSDGLVSVDQSTPVTGLELDIAGKTGTENYDYSYHSGNQTHIYTANESKTFKCVKKGRHTLKTFDQELPVKLVVGYGDQGEIFLSCFYGNGEDFVFSVLTDPDPMSTALKDFETVCAATTRFTVLAGEAYADALRKTAEQGGPEGSELGVWNLTNLLNYAFNNDAKCTEVKYGDKTLWKHDKTKHGDNFPTNVLLNTNTKFLLIDSWGNYQYFYSFINGDWTECFGYKPSAKLIDVQKLSILVANEDGLNVPMDADLYDSKHSQHTYTCTFKDAAKCGVVGYGDDALWRYNESDHRGVYPKTLTLNTKANFLLVDAPANYRYLYSFYNGLWKVVFAYKAQTSEKLDFSRLSLHSLDSDGNIVATDSETYFREDKNDTVCLIFTEDTRCTEVKYDGVTFWKYDKEEYFGVFPTGLTLNESKSLVSVECSRYYRDVFGYYNNKWVELPFGFRVLNVSWTKLSVFTVKPDGKESENDHAAYDLGRFPNSRVFKFNKNYRCTCVKYDGNVVWEHTLGEHYDHYPTLVRLDTKDNTLLVECAGKYSYPYEYIEKEWKLSAFGYKYLPTHVSNLKLVTVVDDECIENDTSQYSIQRDGNLYKFKFNERAMCTELRYAGDSVWNYDVSEHGRYFPTSVTLNTSAKFLIIESGDIYQYFYTYADGKWKSVYFYRSKTPTEPISSDNLKFFTTDDHGGYSELEPSSYTFEQSRSLSGICTFRFTMGTKCCAVKYGSEELWKHDQSVHGDNHLTSVTLNSILGTLSFESFGNYCDLFTYGTGWVKVVLEAKETVEETKPEETTTADEVTEGEATTRKEETEGTTKETDVTTETTTEGPTTTGDDGTGKEETEETTEEAESGTETTTEDSTTTGDDGTGKEESEGTTKETDVTTETTTEGPTTTGDDGTGKEETEETTEAESGTETTTEDSTTTGDDGTGKEESEPSKKTTPTPTEPAKKITPTPTTTPTPTPTEPAKKTTPSVKLVNIDVKTTSSTSDYTYSKDDKTNICTFSAVKGCGFKSVMKGTSEVWKSGDPCLYATKAVNDEQNVLATVPNVTITLSNGTTKRFLSHGGMWILQTNTIELNAATKTSGQHYDCFAVVGTAWYYVPHCGYSFSKVTDGKITFYEAKNYYENSERVDMTKTDDGHDITVHVNDNNPDPIPSEAVKVGPVVAQSGKTTTAASPGK